MHAMLGGQGSELSMLGLRNIVRSHDGAHGQARLGTQVVLAISSKKRSVYISDR